MINTLIFSNNGLIPLEDSSKVTHPLWVDMTGLSHKTFHDILHILQSEETLKGHHTFNPDVLKKITFSKSKDWHVDENGAVYFKLLIMNPTAQNGSHQKTETLILIISKTGILTLRESHSALMADFTNNSRENLTTIADITLAIFNHLIDRTSGFLENELGIVDSICGSLFNQDKHKDSKTLHDITIHVGKTGQFTMNMQQSLETLQRSLEFLINDDRVSNIINDNFDHFREKTEILSTEIDSLQNIAGFLIQNLAYMSEAAIGLIGIKQNDLTLFLSTLAAILVPPGLIISLFGIHFEGMPKISWTFGAPLMLTSMVISSLITYAFLKKGRR